MRRRQKCRLGSLPGPLAFLLSSLVLSSLWTHANAQGATRHNAGEKDLVDLTWTDPQKAAAENPDFLIQGEYASEETGTAWGLQVVALGGGAFDGYLLEGGLPGAGWNQGKRRLKLSGSRGPDQTELVGADNDLKAVLRDGNGQVYRQGKLIADLRRIERSSPTLGAKPPVGAVVLFDGKSAESWINGRVENGLLLNNDITSKQKFGDYMLHLEFRTPYKPYARKQRRGNSGIFHQGRYETQVLDSFGLEGLRNECGGIYSIAAPMINTCLPPLVWQTYDVELTSARFGENDELVEPARITAKLNGILIHKDQELPRITTAAPVKTITEEPGPIFIQHHKNPVYYRNVWILPK